MLLILSCRICPFILSRYINDKLLSPPHTISHTLILTLTLPFCSPSPTPCRDQANALLNTTRASYEPNALLAALSPRILDIPERMKTALMQYLGVIVPYCTDYFSVPQNTGTRSERGRGGEVKGREGGFIFFSSDSSGSVPVCCVTLLLHLCIVSRFWE